MKTCPRCNKSLPLSDFGITTGRNPVYCLVCRAEISRESYQKHADEISERRKLNRTPAEKMKFIKKMCPSGDLPATRHFIKLDPVLENGICPICGVEYEVVEQNDRNRHIGGIDLVLKV